jgi:hypothetical protein
VGLECGAASIDELVQYDLGMGAVHLRSSEDFIRELGEQVIEPNRLVKPYLWGVSSAANSRLDCVPLAFPGDVDLPDKGFIDAQEVVAQRPRVTDGVEAARRGALISGRRYSPRKVVDESAT